jgi:hypothetical protein
MASAFDAELDGMRLAGPVDIYGIQIYSAAAGTVELVCLVTRHRLFKATLAQQQNSYPFHFPSPLHCPHGFEIVELSQGANIIVYVTAEE